MLKGVLFSGYFRSYLAYKIEININLYVVILIT